MGVIGPHSSGKGQLLTSLCGDWRPRGCEITIQGRKLAVARERVSFVPPVPGIFPEMTPSEFLGFFARSHRVPAHYQPYLIWEALSMVGLNPQSTMALAGLTPADRFRLGLARAMVTHPALVVVHGLLDRIDRDLVGEFVQILQRMRQTGASLVVSALSLGPLMGLCSHLCLLVTDRPLICGEVSDLLPQLVHLRMMQIQFLSGFPQAIRFLEQAEGVYHLSISRVTHNLVRFLFDSQHRPFERLLEELQRSGCAIVSVAEDQSFLGRWSP